VRGDTGHALDPLLDSNVRSVLDKLKEKGDADADCYIEKCPKEAETQRYEYVGHQFVSRVGDLN
jgi:hypothetical protein